MSNLSHQSGFRQFAPPPLRAVAASMATLLAMFLITVPMTRSSEINERIDSSERCEELKFSNRNDRIRRQAMETLRSPHARAHVVTTQSVGHAQLPDLDPPAGHRLTNGLLAPMTC